MHPTKRLSAMTSLLVLAGFAVRAGEIPDRLRLEVPSGTGLAEADRLFDDRTDWVYIDYNGLIDRAMFERIGQCKDLRYLSLQPRWDGADGKAFDTAVLDPLLRLKKLEGFWLLGFIQDIDDAWMARMAPAFPELTALSLQPKPGTITARGYESLASLKKLKKFILYHSGIDADGLSALIRGLPALEEFWAAYTGPQDPALDAAGLEGLAECEKMADLWLPLAPDAGDDAVERIVKACPNLRRLNLSNGAKITPRGLARLADLKHLGGLSLYGNIPVDDGGLAELSRLAGLTRLDLQCALNVTDDGLALMGKLKRMYWLHIGSHDSDISAVTDEGVARMAAAMTSLGQLMIFGRNRLGDPLLAALAGHPTLYWVQISGDGFTREGEAEFLRRNPKAKVRIQRPPPPEPAPAAGAGGARPPLPAGADADFF